jgi:hypothetical protein
MGDMVIPRVLVLAAVLVLPGVPASQGPPGDREVRTTTDAFTGDTLTTLTLMLKGPHGPLPINMAITRVEKTKSGGGSGPAYRLEFDMPMYTGALDYKTPQVTLDLGGGQRLSYDVDPRATPPTVTHIGVPTFSAGDLARLAGSTTMRGRLFGIEFVLTTEQVRAVQSFARR